MKLRGRSAAIALSAVAAAAVLYFALHSSDRSASPSQKIRIEIASIIEIDPVTQLREGFKEQIAKSSIAGRVEYIERNAQGETRLISQIASEVPNIQPRLVYVLGTPLAQAIQKQNPTVLLLQGGVTDPVASGLANSWQGSGRVYAATSDRPPVGVILDAIARLTPTRRTIGAIYNPGESNSVAVIAQLRTLAATKGFTLREFGVGSIQDLPTAISSALSRSEVLFIPPDNLVTSGLKAIIQSAALQKIPVYATTADAVDLGALASASTDFRELGRETADLAVQIIVEGKDPATIPIQLPMRQKIIVNSKVAQQFGVSLDQARSAGYTIR